MTHTLHRVKTVEGRTNDYVVLIMPARSINNQNCVEVYKKYIDLLAPFHPVNMGGIGIGNLATNTIEELRENVTAEAPMLHAVFKDRDTLVEVMKALREAD